MAIRNANDPHVLATILKQWLRRLPAPLIPSASYRALVGLGQQSMRAGGTHAGGRLPPTLESALPSLVRSLPQPNLLCLHALVELLEAVVARESVNRMSASNLAVSSHGVPRTACRAPLAHATFAPRAAPAPPPPALPRSRAAGLTNA